MFCSILSITNWAEIKKTTQTKFFISFIFIIKSVNIKSLSFYSIIFSNFVSILEKCIRSIFLRLFL